jgi:hypothetical protein
MSAPELKKINMYEAFPLYWPVGYKRTQQRKYSQFKVTMDKAQKFLRAEISRMGVTNLVVSTNIPVRQDGGLYADWMNRKIDDPGVAIYFKYKNKEVSMCCDQYEKVWENVYALGKGIEALRGMERWGVSDFLDRAFTGFTALPPAVSINQKSIWEILGFKSISSEQAVRDHYIMIAKERHPDAAGGSVEAFQELNDAYQAALKYFKNIHQ